MNPGARLACRHAGVRGALVLMGCCLLACKSAPAVAPVQPGPRAAPAAMVAPPPSTPQARTGGPAAGVAPSTNQATSPEPGEDIVSLLTWALGADVRLSTPGTAAYALLLPVGSTLDRGRRLTSDCGSLTSLLPVPAQNKVFMVSDGALVATPAQPASPGKPLPVTGATPGLRLTRLLAFATATSPLTLLVVAIPSGKSAEEVWKLSVDLVGATFLGAEHINPKNEAERNAVLAGHEAPRCLPGGNNCLIISRGYDECFLDVEPRRGARRKQLQTLGDVDVRDARWGSSDGRSVYLLLGCKAGR